MQAVILDNLLDGVDYRLVLDAPGVFCREAVILDNLLDGVDHRLVLDALGAFCGKLRLWLQKQPEVFHGVHDLQLACFPKSLVWR